MVQQSVFQVTNDLQPVDRGDMEQRAIYLASAFFIGAADSIKNYIQTCRQGTLGEKLKKATTRDFPPTDFFPALKELTCLNIYIAMLEQGGIGVPEWLNLFFGISMRATDKLYPTTSAKEIMQMHEFVAGKHDICIEGAVSICRRMRIDPTCLKDAVEPLRNFLDTCDSYRGEVLRYALTQPADVLRSTLK